MSRRITIAATVFALVCSLRVLCAEGSDDALRTCDLNISNQSLDAALQEVARQCGVQVLYFSDITTGKSATNLSGRYAVDDALHLLLANTGLDFSHVNARTIQIRPGPPATATAESKVAAPPISSQSEATLDEVVIIGTAEGLVATRIETPLRDVAQSISVVSAEQMRLQNDFDFNDVFANISGLTVTRQDSLFQLSYSRAFQVNSFTLDGGGALRDFSHNLYGGVLLLPDLSAFDHVEVLRGANALFGANSEPGGAINLVRKRPLHDARLMLTSSGGSWNSFRQEVDVTGPLALDGNLRGRLGVSFGKHDYFYDHANDERKSIFGVLDYDLGPDTLLSIGGSYSKDRGQPFEGGLPRLSNGSDPQLPRDTAYVFNWSRMETRVIDAYARLEQNFGADWNLKVNATALDNSNDYLVGNFVRPIDATTLGITLRPFARYTIGPARQRQLNLEATLTGASQWGDHAVEMAFGGDFLRVDSHSLTGQIGLSPPLANAYDFDPAVYPNPVTDPLDGRDVSQEVTRILSGLFASLRIQATQRWSVTAGLRVSNEKVEDHSLFYFGDFEFPLIFDYEYKNIVTPFLGTVFTINDHYSVYASYADIYRSNSGLVRGDGSELSPSHGINTEIGVKAEWRNGALTGSLALFRIVDRGGAMFDPDIEPTVPECCYTSNGRNVSKGADLELTGRPAPDWIIGAGYTFNESEPVTAGDQVAHLLYQQTPKHLFKLWTNYTMPTGWSLGGSIHAQGDMHNDSRDCPVLSATGFCRSGYQNFRKVQGAYVIVSPRIGYQFNEHWQAALTIENLFDRQYYESLGTINGSNWYGEPRSYLIRLDGRY